MSTHALASLRSKLLSSNGKIFADLQKRCLSYDEVVKKRNELFDYEKKRQRDAIGRIEKIEVRYLGLPEDATLVMNKHISTPHHVAQHLNEIIAKNSALALVNNTMLWDMHKPLEDSCTIQLLNFKIQDPSAVNRAFWRSCSFMMGAVLHRVLKEETGLFLHSFPKPSIRSGSFIHDFALNKKGWKPNVQELKTISIEMQKFASENHAFERLKVNHDLAFEMFKDNPFKREQLPSISNSQDGNVVLYRAGDHIDISGGPMIANTNFLHRLNIASVHEISRAEDTCNLYRIQGIGLPQNFRISAYALKILNERAKKLNNSWLPQEVVSDSENSDGQLNSSSENHNPELQKFQNVN